MDCSLPVSYLCPRDLPGKNTRMGCHFLLQGIFLTQGLNPGLLHCKQILYCLSQQGSLKVSQSGAYFYFLNKSLVLNQIIFFFILPLNTLAHCIYIYIYIYIYICMHTYICVCVCVCVCVCIYSATPWLGDGGRAAEVVQRWRKTPHLVKSNVNMNWTIHFLKYTSNEISRSQPPPYMILGLKYWAKF